MNYIGYRFAPEYLLKFYLSFLKHLRLLEIQDNRFTTKSYGWRAPFLWNDMPLFLGKSDNVNIFKRNLKTYLFKKSFS